MHQPQCVPPPSTLGVGRRWGRDSFALATVCHPLPWVEVGEGLICINHASPSTLGGGGGGAHCINHSVSPYTLSEGGEGAHLHQSPSTLGRRWGRGSFASTTVCLPLPWGRGSFVLTTVCLPLPWVEVGEGFIASITVCLPLPWVEVGEGLIVHRPQCVSLYLGWRWGRGSLWINHSVSPSTLGGGGGGAHLHQPQCVSLYLE